MTKLRVAAVAVGSSVVAAMAIFLSLVHPNDARIAGPFKPIKQETLDRRNVRVISMLGDRLPHSVDMGQDAYRKTREVFEKRLPAYASTASLRFTSPYQVYVAVGNYPARLEARDAVFLPSGATLTLEIPVSGEARVRLGLTGMGADAEVDVTTGHDKSVLSLKSPGRPVKTVSQVDRYWEVDQAGMADTWADGEATVAAGHGGQLKVACNSAGDGCLVSDIMFDEEAEPRDSFVVILVDTLRGDGPTGGFAPHMEKLASESTVFAKALAPGNMTSPSTNGLLSCLRPSRMGGLAFAYGVNRERREAYYRLRHRSFPERFARAGYETAMIGNVSVISEVYGAGVHHGFARQVALETDGYETPQVAREAIRWLEANGARPFLLYLHFNGPHAPYRAPLADILATLRIPGSFASYPDILRSLYQAEIRHTDRYVGKIIDAIDALGLSSRTNIVLTADHGDQHESRPFEGNYGAPDFEGAYFDHGATLLNDEIRVPLMVRTPSREGRVVADTYVSTLDLGSTLLDLAKIESAGPWANEVKCDGRTLATYLATVSGAPSKPDGASFETLGSEGFQGRAVLFDNRYKYIRSYDATDKRVYATGSWLGERRLYYAPEQLYDLAQDSLERHNLVESDKGLLAKARDEYRRYYGIEDVFELVIDNPDGGAIEAEIAHVEGAKIIEGHGEIRRRDQALVVSGRDSSRLLVRTGPGVPDVRRVTVGGTPLQVTYTSLKLPLLAGVEGSPTELPGVGSLPTVATTPAAFLRRVEDNGQEGRRIVAGNPDFEKILREWGYLNDR